MNYGRYQIISELGRGAMGMVYQAHDPQIDRLVALKVLREDRLTTGDYVQRFLKEATAIGRLSHPGIVTVYDVGQDHGTIYIAMEFLEGQPLDQLAAGHCLQLSKVTEIGAQVARALHYAHEKGIVHRDIKPPNIIFTGEGKAKVTDFGIAHIDDPDGQQMTRAGEILGTPVYMAPEQVMGQPVDGRSDLYSLGVILYELTTGQRPFQGENIAAVFRAITQDNPVPPDQINPDIPPALARLIMKAMARDPADRFVTGKAMADILDTCLDAHAQQTVSLQPTSQKKRLIPVVLSVLVFILVIGASLAAYRYYSSSLSLQIGKPSAPPNPDEQTEKKITDHWRQSGMKAKEKNAKSLLPEFPTSDTTKEPWIVRKQNAKEKITNQQQKKERQANIKRTVSSKRLPDDFHQRTPTKKEKNRQEQQAIQSIDDLFSTDELMKPGADKKTNSTTGQGNIPSQMQGDTKSGKKSMTSPTPHSHGNRETRVATLPPSTQHGKSKSSARSATLNVNSRPQGARLYMDGDYRGVTPLELHVVAEKHEIKLELQGHLGWQAQLDLSKGGNIPLSVRLLAE